MIKLKSTSKAGFLNRLQPQHLLDSISQRGIGGTWHHALRRLGTMRETAMIGPELIRINPMGWVCNHTCPMCWLQHLEPEHLKQQKKIDREEGMKLADYARMFNSMPSGLREVNVVGGGEPLVHPDAVEIFAEIKRHRWIGSLVSNGTLLKESLAERMIAMNWDQARISVHAGDAETYREIQGVDRFETMRTNLKTYDRIRRATGKAGVCRLVVFHVIQRENIPTIEKLFAIAEEVGADAIEFDPIIPYDSAKWLTADEWRQAREAIASCAAASRLPCNAKEIIPQMKVEESCAKDSKPFVPGKSCSIGFDQSFITSLGEVLPCCFSREVMGNVREQDFSTIWFGEKYTNFRKRLINGKFAKYCIDNRCTLPNVIQK